MQQAIENRGSWRIGLAGFAFFLMASLNASAGYEWFDNRNTYGQESGGGNPGPFETSGTGVDGYSTDGGLTNTHRFVADGPIIDDPGGPNDGDPLHVDLTMFTTDSAGNIKARSGDGLDYYEVGDAVGNGSDKKIVERLDGGAVAAGDYLVMDFRLNGTNLHNFNWRDLNGSGDEVSSSGEIFIGYYNDGVPVNFLDSSGTGITTKVKLEFGEGGSKVKLNPGDTLPAATSDNSLPYGAGTADNFLHTKGGEEVIKLKEFNKALGGVLEFNQVIVYVRDPLDGLSSGAVFRHTFNGPSSVDPTVEPFIPPLALIPEPSTVLPALAVIGLSLAFYRRRPCADR